MNEVVSNVGYERVEAAAVRLTEEVAGMMAAKGANCGGNMELLRCAIYDALMWLRGGNGVFVAEFLIGQRLLAVEMRGVGVRVVVEVF